MPGCDDYRCSAKWPDNRLVFDKPFLRFLALGLPVDILDKQWLGFGKRTVRYALGLTANPSSAHAICLRYGRHSHGGCYGMSGRFLGTDTNIFQVQL